MATLIPAPAPLRIQLSASGVDLAQGGELTISALGKSFRFAVGVAQPVDADDWTWLRTRPNPLDGQKLFEIAPAVVQSVAAAKTPGPVVVLKPVPATEAESTDPTKEYPGK